MIVSTVRLYERILMGLESEDERTQAAAQSLLSFLVIHLRLRQIVLPTELVPLMERLPVMELA